MVPPAASSPREGRFGAELETKASEREKGFSLTTPTMNSLQFWFFSPGSGLLLGSPAPCQRQLESHCLGSGFMSGFSCSILFIF